MAKPAVDIEAAAHAGQIDPGDPLPGLHIDEGLAHLACPARQLGFVVAAQAAHFVEAGLHQGVLRQRAPIDQLQREGLRPA